MLATPSRLKWEAEVRNALVEPESTAGVGCQVFLLALMWWSAAVVVALEMKRLLSPISNEAALYPYPFALTGTVNLAVASIAWLLVRAVECAQTKCFGHASQRKELTTYEALVLYGMGTCQGVELALGNKALCLLSVSTNRMAVACCVVFQLGTSVLWGLEKLGPTKMAAAVVLVGGGVLESLRCQRSTGLVAAVCGPHQQPGSEETEDLELGWALVVLSALLSSNRWALTQFVLQKSTLLSAVGSMSKLQLLPYMSPATSAVCLGMAATFEQNAFSAFIRGMQSMSSSLLIIAVSILTLTVCELRIVHVTAATVMMVLAAVHNIPMLLAGVLINGDAVFRNQWLGFILCTIGAILYFTARLWDEVEVSGMKKEDADEEELVHLI